MRFGCGRGPLPARWWSALSTSMLLPRSWSASVSALLHRRIWTRNWRTSVYCWRTHSTRTVIGCLDFPAHGIIRGRWEIQDFELNARIPDGTFGGAPIGGLYAPGGHRSWPEPLDQAIAGVAQPLNRGDMETLRAEVERIAGAHPLGGLPSNRVATGSISDLARVNRIGGLTLGFGASAALPGSRIRIRPTLAYGTSDQRLLGSLGLSWQRGTSSSGISAGRRVVDFSDLQVISPLLNSLTAQEAGDDHGDYVLLHSLELEGKQGIGAGTSVR